MFSFVQLKRLFLVIVAIGLLGVTGCSDEKIRQVAQDRLRLAQTQLQEARDFGAPMYASEAYSLAEIKYSEGKQKVDNSQYDLAIKDWEDFQVLITKAKAQAIAFRDKDENAKRLAKEAADKLEAERRRQAELASQQQALLDKQRQLEEEQRRLAALRPQQVVVAPVAVSPVPVVASEPSSIRKVGNQRVVVLKKGDYLCKISREVYGDHMKWKKIYRLNNKSVRNPDKVYPGQAIVLPQ